MPCFLLDARLQAAEQHPAEKCFRHADGRRSGGGVGCIEVVWNLNCRDVEI